MIPHLYYFKPEEFRQWYKQMDPRLLVLLDSLRHAWGKPIMVSSAKGSLGRHLRHRDSQHNVERYAEVRAADLFPGGLETRQDASEIVELADMTGFTGIGIYPDFNPSCGLHLDTRRDRLPGEAATWGAVRESDDAPLHYVTIEEAIDKLPT